jgi:hypothetical protein
MDSNALSTKSRDPRCLPEDAMKTIRLPAVPLASAVAFSGPVFAQDWESWASLYGWGPDTSVTLDTPAGPVTGDVSFSEAWEALDLAFMGTFSAQRGKLSFILDTLFVSLTDLPRNAGCAWVHVG